ncbi:MAG: hypothetical protein GC159_20410 [Phycisphaera sp.]|nr:hypothetical protein [Phycisphaera sp.]
MAKAVVEPEELRRFARDLSRFNSEIQNLTSAMTRRLNDLEKSWRDQEQKKFAEEFKQTARVLSKFTEASNQHIQFLGRKASHIEEYLRQR